jgi:predicted ATP-binding protein involved in virulence
MIKRFNIKKLFGFRNVNILFEDDTKILIGENGLGKTTVLNSLYYVLTEKYAKLFQIEFEEIVLEFKTKEKISFTKEELGNYLQYGNRRIRNRLSNQILDIIDVEELHKYIEKNSKKENDLTTIISMFLQKFSIPRFAPTQYMTKEIINILKEPLTKKFREFNNILKDKNLSILYFPTYRRVEEDLKNIGEFKRKIRHNPFDDDEIYIEEIDEEIEISEDTLIHFGMEDVKKRIKEIESQIKQSSINGFSKVTGEMLSQLLKGFPDIKDEEIENLDINTIKIVVHRVGDNLNNLDRKKILSLLDNIDELKQKKELVYFILKLVDIYEQHKHLDDSIKRFKDTCNAYLVDKDFRYNESSVSLKIYRENTTDIVELDKLSSGEKQIVSLLSKLHFGQFNNLIILFDEPELSLSIKWQERLLPDIVNTNKVKFLLAVTHSPFIFKNELERFAIGMNVYVN